ncbi:MAG: hypothetical protein R3A47_12305 [Polyangiales bacterium]
MRAVALSLGGLGVIAIASLVYAWYRLKAIDAQSMPLLGFYVAVGAAILTMVGAFRMRRA